MFFLYIEGFSIISILCRFCLRKHVIFPKIARNVLILMYFFGEGKKNPLKLVQIN